MAREVRTGWRLSQVKLLQKVIVPASLPSVLVNLCHHDVLALKRSGPTRDGILKALTNRSAVFLEVGGLSQRDSNKVVPAHTKHPLLHPLPDLLYPELDMIAILVRWPHARL